MVALPTLEEIDIITRYRHENAELKGTIEFQRNEMVKLRSEAKLEVAEMKRQRDDAITLFKLIRQELDEAQFRLAGLVK